MRDPDMGFGKRPRRQQPESNQIDMFATPEPEAHARRTDPETSHFAAASVVQLRDRQLSVLRALNAIEHETGPTIDQHLIVAYRRLQRHAPDVYLEQTDQSIRSRRKELCDLDLVEYGGSKGETSSGGPSRRWKLTAAGRAAIDRARVT